MPFDFSSYQVEMGEHPASAGKHNNLVFAIQEGMNRLPVASLTGYPGDAGKFLNGGSGWTLPTTDLAAIYRKTDRTLVRDTLSAEDLFGGGLAIAGGRLGAFGSIRIFASGTMQNDTGADRTVAFSLLLGSVPIWTSTPTTVVVDANQRAWRLKAIVQALASTASQQGGGTLLLSHPDKPTTGTGAIRASNGNIFIGPFLTAKTTLDMTANQALAFTVTFGSKSSDLWMACDRARVEVTV